MKTPEQIHAEARLKNRVLNLVKEEEQYLLGLRERLEAHKICAVNNSIHKYHVAKMHALIEVLDALSVNREQFNWIFNI